MSQIRAPSIRRRGWQRGNVAVQNLIGLSRRCRTGSPNHVPRFIQVMLSCSTVAIETQTKYGT